MEPCFSELKEEDGECDESVLQGDLSNWELAEGLISHLPVFTCSEGTVFIGVIS